MKKKKIFFVNGYLGAGKTSVINQLLLSGKLSKVFIIENEMASYNVDGQCLHLDPKQVKVLSGECICCGSPEELVKILKKIHAEYDNVIIESSGVTSMKNLLVKILEHKELEDMFQIQACVLVVDALGLERTNILDLEVSDFVLVTKKDALQTERQHKKLETFTGKTFQHVDFKIKEGIEDSSWIEKLLKNTPRSFRDWALTVHDSKHHGENFVQIVGSGNLKKFDTRNIFTNMHLYQIVRLKGFYKLNGKIIHVEMTPEQVREEEGKEMERFGIVVIGQNKLLLEEFIRDVIE